jgi:hypothetical protein
MESSPEHDPRQIIRTNPPAEWNVDDLVEWIQRKRPNLLNDDKIEKLRKAEITGEDFLAAAGNWEFFQNGCNLPAGPSMALANLSRELAKEDSKLLSFMSCTPRREQANNVTGNRQQAGDVEMSNAADMKSKLLSFISCTPRIL